MQSDNDNLRISNIYKTTLQLSWCPELKQHISKI